MLDEAARRALETRHFRAAAAVHAFIAVLSLLLGLVLLRRAQQRVGYRGTLRGLIQHLSAVRTCTVIQARDEGGRPRVREHLEECTPVRCALAEALQALSAEASYIRPRAPNP